MQGFIELEKKYLPTIDLKLRREFPEIFKRKETGKRRKVQNLTETETVRLFALYKSGNEQASNKLILSQLKLVYLYAKKFHLSLNGTALPEDDIVGFANLILLEILPEYEPYMNGKFCSLASYIRTWLEYNLLAKIKEYGLVVRLPTNKISELTLRKRYLGHYVQKHNEQPGHGDSIEIFEKGEHRKIVFNLLDQTIDIFVKQNNTFEFKKSVNYDLNECFEIISGNNTILDNEDETLEYFDCFASDNTHVFEDEFKVVSKEINKVLDSLPLREQESVKLFYIDNEQLKSIPCKLTPNFESSSETRTLQKSSLNRIEIFIEGEESISYEFTSNYHVKSEEATGEIKSKCLTPLFGRETVYKTSAEDFEFSFEMMKPLKKIKIVHQTVKDSKEVQYSITGNILQFSVDFQMGYIFTPQTFLNNIEAILSKLRRKLIHLQDIIKE
jgi:DNA-directed RNA polymerase sigma subunit (sigma70/sigma32)